MCNKTEELPVLTLSDFNTHNFGFVMMPIELLRHNHHFLKRAHKQSYYTMFFCQNGQGSITVDKQLVALQSNSVVCIGPNSVSSLDMHGIHNGWAIYFSDSFFSMRYNENVLYNFECLQYNNVCEQMLDNDAAMEWQFYMQLMNREHQTDSKEAQNILRSYMNIILSILNRNNAPALESRTVRSIKDKNVIAFEQLIEAHYKSEKLPSFYAGVMNITVNYLNRICQEKRNISCGEMIRKRVAKEAERLLFHTYNSVSEIAIELGFESTSYFTTFFKKHTGLSPDNFRKLNK